MIWNRRFLHLRGHYGFHATPCTPATPREKGSVEAQVRYLKSGFWPARRFTDLRELDGEYADWRDQVCNRRTHATGRYPVAERLAEERQALRPLPPRRLPAGGGRPSRPSSRIRGHTGWRWRCSSVRCSRGRCAIVATRPLARRSRRRRSTGSTTVTRAGSGSLIGRGRSTHPSLWHSPYTPRRWSRAVLSTKREECRPSNGYHRPGIVFTALTFTRRRRSSGPRPGLAGGVRRPRVPRLRDRTLRAR